MSHLCCIQDNAPIKDEVLARLFDWELDGLEINEE
jgi:hypothetical protein